MIRQESLLVRLARLVDRLPEPRVPEQRRRGHLVVYSQHLFLKAVVIMLVRHIHTVSNLLAVLEQPTSEMQQLRALLTEGDR